MGELDLFFTSLLRFERLLLSLAEPPLSPRQSSLLPAQEDFALAVCGGHDICNVDQPGTAFDVCKHVVGGLVVTGTGQPDSSSSGDGERLEMGEGGE